MPPRCVGDLEIKVLLRLQGHGDFHCPWAVSSMWLYGENFHAFVILAWRNFNVQRVVLREGFSIVAVRCYTEYGWRNYKWVVLALLIL